MTNEEFFERAEWEGGIFEYVCEYGVDPENIEDEELSVYVASLRNLYDTQLKPLLNAIRGLER